MSSVVFVFIINICRTVVLQDTAFCSLYAHTCSGITTKLDWTVPPPHFEPEKSLCYTPRYISQYEIML